jgi:hypothetical protein
MKRNTVICSILSLVLIACGNLSSPTGPSFGSNLSAGQNQVWIAPNVCSEDMLNLFTEPDKWIQAKSKTNVMKFYPPHLDGNLSSCNNTLTNFANIVPGGAFRWLSNQNPKIEIAVEAGSVKEWNCGGKMPDENFASISRIINNVEVLGGRVSYIAMDEPFTAIETNCKQPVETTSKQVKYYVDKVNARHPGVSIGLIEAYPFLSEVTIEESILALKGVGVNIPFLHLDMHRHGGLARSDIRGDLVKLKDFCHKHNIAFGIIVWGDDGSSNQVFSNEAIMTAETVNSAVGAPDHIIFQSWESSTGRKLLTPDNLPENQPHTMTWIVNVGLAIFGIR